ncbi:SdrD B-like domain-containing protein [Actinophytocola algeriensis]|uniref:SD-repeat containing protein B domain-containing protein n=1 Tax=Actinophytocola algeriensis TaxID=1768010 RepID=A0A7W7VDL2_9PSEU|nr:SdrD B-like domain-containing protein [Actinophytocola algeriensis]MBB4906105.1 hypothetical protein [Actinophytocola algeriensis]MBE1472210.1 hypothetical protein [Actinophytocola algeriensis]
MAVAGVLTGAAGVARAEPESPDVAVVATRFDKLAYQAGEEAAVSFTLANYGQVDAEHVVINSGGNGDSWELGITDWGGVEYEGEGVNILAGERVTVVLRGVVSDGSYDVGRVTIAYGFGAANGDYDESNNIGSARASVPGATGIMMGDAMYDQDGDGQLDPGEGVPDVKVTIVGLFDIEHIATVHTDADGHFGFTDLPVGEYEFRVTPPAGWWLVHGGNVSHVEVRRTEYPGLRLEVEPVT